MCLGDCQLRRLKPAGEEDMRVYRAIASNYETEKARMTDTVIIPRALLEQALDTLIWTTGSADFGEGGKAHSGAVQMLYPTITAISRRIRSKTYSLGVSISPLGQPAAARTELEQPQQEDKT